MRFSQNFEVLRNDKKIASHNWSFFNEFYVIFAKSQSFAGEKKNSVNSFRDWKILALIFVYSNKTLDFGNKRLKNKPGKFTKSFIINYALGGFNVIGYKTVCVDI